MNEEILKSPPKAIIPPISNIRKIMTALKEGKKKLYFFIKTRIFIIYPSNLKTEDDLVNKAS